MMIKVEESLESGPLKKLAHKIFITLDEDATMPVNAICVKIEIPPPAQFLFNQEAMGMISSKIWFFYQSLNQEVNF